MNTDAAVFWIGAAVLFVIVWMWEPTAAFGIWWSVLALLVVGGFGLALLRRRSLAEFPEASLEVGFEGLKQAVSGAWGSLSGRVRAGRSSSSAGDPVERLAALQALHASGALTDDEFTRAKASVLDAG